MAGTLKGKVILKSVPSKEVEAQVAEHLSGIYQKVPFEDLLEFVSRTKPLALVNDIPEEMGKLLADHLKGLGATAFFLQDLNSAQRH